MRDSTRTYQSAEAKRPVRIVVEGFGSVVGLYYEPAFRELLAEISDQIDVKVVFADTSRFWQGDLSLRQKMEDLKSTVLAWGAVYLDKSDPDQLAEYLLLEADYVIVATPDFTHVEVTEGWLKRNPGPKAIFIEKPLSRDLKDARRLLRQIEPFSDRVLAFDHYRARLLPSRKQYETMLTHLGKGVKRFTFYFLEDHSGADPAPKYQQAGHDGPIENEGRVLTLNQGLILDGLPHMIALLAHFGRPETLRIVSVQAGQYVGVDGDPEKRTEIAKETFACVQFVFFDHRGHRVDGVAYVGKGVRGVRHLPRHFDYNAKLMEVEGLNGNKVRFDLRSSKDGSRAYLLDGTDRTELEFGLYVQPYKTFLEKVVSGTYLVENLALHVEVGKRILEVLDDMRDPIPDNKEEIPTYPCGMRDRRDSLYLEDILPMLPPL